MSRDTAAFRGMPRARWYGDVLDGLRSFYESREGASSDPTFSAAMLLSFLGNLNAAAALAIGSIVRHAPMDLSGSGKLRLLAVGIAVAVAHVVGAKLAGFSSRTGAARNAGWKTLFWAYLAVTMVAALVASVGYVAVFS